MVIEYIVPFVYTQLWYGSSMLQIGMRRSQSKSASVGCGFHVQNPSDADADLSHNEN